MTAATLDPAVGEPAAILVLGASELAFVLAGATDDAQYAALRELLQLRDLDSGGEDVALAVIESLHLRGLAVIRRDRIDYAPQVAALVALLGAGTRGVVVGTARVGESGIGRFVCSKLATVAFVPTGPGAYAVSLLSPVTPIEQIVLELVGRAAATADGPLAVAVAAVELDGAASAPAVRFTVAGGKPDGPLVLDAGAAGALRSLLGGGADPASPRVPVVETA